jgi:hypothetical protein
MRGNASDPSPHFGRRGPGAIGRGVGGAYAIGVAERGRSEAGRDHGIEISIHSRLLNLDVRSVVCLQESSADLSGNCKTDEEHRIAIRNNPYKGFLPHALWR